MSACDDCGASGRFGSCEVLFRTLLALDHQRLAPWGPHHGLNVACYHLQHPSSAPEAAAGGQWALVDAYGRGGLDEVHRLERRLVSRNRRGAPAVEAATAPARRHPPSFTIEDVSVDGSFPRDGYEERVARWVSSVLTERATSDR